ncbi:hypothetical protein J6590_008782 [Homalodisca vitripennis]|nr:hypothetical protein J6590_008782 [Homalodisca vitripennis]
MGSIKTYYSEYIRQWLRQSNRPLGPYDTAELFGKAYLQCQTASIAVKGFSETGIFPCNRTVFSDVDFLPSTPAIRDEPHEDLALPSTSTKNPALPNTSSEDHAITGTSSELPNLANTCSNICVSPHDIMPLPPMKRKTSNKGRKPSSCAVFTSSPYKQQLEESLSKTKHKLPPTGKKTGKRSKASSSAKTWNKRLHFDKESDAEEHSESISSGESNLELPVGVEKPSDEDALCIFCGDPFSKDELWIQCQLCDEWSHSECAGVKKDIYVCDFCKLCTTRPKFARTRMSLTNHLRKTPLLIGKQKNQRVL